MDTNSRANVIYTSASAGLGAIAGSGNTAPFDLQTVSNVLVIARIAASSGSSPTLDVYLDFADTFGGWLPQAFKIGSQLTTGPNYTSAAAGLNIASTGSTCLPQSGRLSWVVTGTGSPTFTGVQLVVIGR